MKTVLVNDRPYRAENCRYEKGEKTADVYGYYGPILQWRPVGCKKKIAMVLEQSWEEPLKSEIDGQLLLF